MIVSNTIYIYGVSSSVGKSSYYLQDHAALSCSYVRAEKLITQFVKSLIAAYLT